MLDGKLQVSESYMMGIDIGEDYGDAVLTVTKRDGWRVEVVNVFVGMEAIELYEKLTKKGDV